MAELESGRYKSKLSELHCDCELNYLRLNRLLVAIRERSEWVFAARNNHGLAVSVIEQTAHTTHLLVQGAIGRTRWLGNISLVVRVYHDARMAEVVLCQNQHVALLRYAYPNAQMYQPNEKTQLNRLLGQWLEHFLQSGWLVEPVPQF